MKAIQINDFGGSEVIQYKEIPVPSPGPDDVLVQLGASGVNFIDIYQRTGLYTVGLPYVLGLEGAGVVKDVGSNVIGFSIGDRVTYSGVPGSYAEYVLVPAKRLVQLPEGLNVREAAAAMVQGMTAHYLAYSTYPLKPGNSCLIHAAAGGVGLLLVQMAKRCGASVIGTVSSEEKASLAEEAGADSIILYTEQDFEAGVNRLTEGKGVDVVYDSVGKSTFEKSLNSLVPRGSMVLYGQSSGPVPPLDPLVLNRKGSLFLTRPSLAYYISDRPSLERRAGEVLGWVLSGELKLRIVHTFPLSDASEAHRSLEGRKTTGKVLLIP